MDDSDSNKILPDIFLEKISDAYSYCQIITDETGKPSDYQFLNINVAFARLIGLGLNEVVGKKISELETKCKSMRCDLIQFFGDRGAPVSHQLQSVLLSRYYPKAELRKQ